MPPSLVQSGAEVVELAGLGVDEAKSLLREAWLEGDERAWSDLVERYGGNPLALQLVADSIRQLFDGDIGTFTEQVPTGTLVGSIRRLLDSEFQRLSPIEIDVARLLALNREPMTFAEISTQLAQAGSRSVLLEAVEALRHRSLLQPAACGRASHCNRSFWTTSRTHLPMLSRRRSNRATGPAGEVATSPGRRPRFHPSNSGGVGRSARPRTPEPRAAPRTATPGAGRPVPHPPA